jgi:histidinol-phosphatase (PHP family)
MGGRFCMSDDSHGIEQVGFGYRQVLDFVAQTGITVLHYLDLSDEGTPFDSRFPSTRIRSVSVEELEQKAFYQEV